MAYCLAISGDYRFKFQERLLLWLVEDSPSPGTTASVPGDSYAGRLRCLAISGGYCFTLDGDTPKPPRGERNSSSIPSPLRESAHKGPGVLNHRANEPSMTICALLCPR